MHSAYDLFKKELMVQNIAIKSPALHEAKQGNSYVQTKISEVNLINVRISQKNFLFRYTHEGVIGEFLASVIGLYRAKLAAVIFVIIHRGTKKAVFACRLDIVTKKLLFHIKTS